MHSTLLYNHITLWTNKCEEDLEIFFLPGEGHLNEVEPIVRMIDKSIYKLYVGSTYVLGPHDIYTVFEEKRTVNTSYNIYKIHRMLPSAPRFHMAGDQIVTSEVIEAEVLWSNNRLTYYDFIYGDR